MKGYRTVNHSLLEDAIATDGYSPLAFFILLKFKFDHGRFQSYRQVASVLGMSLHTVTARMNFLKNKGLVQKIGRVYWLKSNKDLPQTKRKITVLLDHSDTLKTVEYKLQFKVVEQYIEKQEHLISEKRIIDLCNKPGFARGLTRKRARKIERKYGSIHAATIAMKRKYAGFDFVMFDNEYLGQKLNRSKGSIQNLKNFLEAQKLITTANVWRTVATGKKIDFLAFQASFASEIPHLFYENRFGLIQYRVGTKWNATKYWIKTVT